MKNVILSWAIVVLLIAGCGNKKSNPHTHDGEAAHEHSTGTHQHEDGSVHDDHDDAGHQQEEFKAGADSAAEKAEKEHGHQHDEGSHKH